MWFYMCMGMGMGHDVDLLPVSNVIAHMNLTSQGDGSTGRFIKCFKPRRKYMYHLFYTDKALHVSHAVQI